MTHFCYCCLSDINTRNKQNTKISQIEPKYFLLFHIHTNHVKLDLNKKSFPKQNTFQNFTIDAQGLRKTRNENPPIREIGVTS